MVEKPFKGVISNWRMNEGRVHGICVFHTTYGNGIADNESITTSTVAQIYRDKNSVLICETRNSRYVLV